MDEKKIEAQVSELLDKFAKVLEENGVGEGDSFVDRDLFEREESEGVEGNFKEDFLKNAPKKDKDFLIVEKGDWK